MVKRYFYFILFYLFFLFLSKGFDMPLGTVYHSKPMIRTSSTSSGNEESSAKDKPSGRKTKKYVKKKGETRKRNSNDVSKGKNAAELADEILKKLDNMVIKNEIESSNDLQGTSSNEFLKLGEKIAIKEAENKKNGGDIENVNKIENSGKSCSTAESEGSKVGGKLDEMNGELKGKKEYSDCEITKKDSKVEFANNKSKEKDPSKCILGVMEKDFQKFKKKNVDEVKTADQQQQQQQEDRQRMRILKGVTKFSKKFMKAIKKLENDHRKYF